MSEIELSGGFFNATMIDGEPDRVYTAEQINDYFKGLVSENGIFANMSSACQVQVGTGMQVIIKEGKGKVGSNWFLIDRDITLDIPASDVILGRIDSVVIRRDKTNRTITIALKQGELASSPVAPTLTRNETIYEICIANILVNKNVSSITSAMIEDTRSNTNVCGWIVCLIEHFDTTTLFEQYKTAQEEFINEATEEFNSWEESQKELFNAWFDEAQERVSATNLYREYSYVYATIEANEKVLAIPSAINYVFNSTDILEININGMRLTKDLFTINTDNTITLVNALSVVGTPVEFVNKKCVEGNVDDSTILRVEALEDEVNAIGNYVYEASGNNDNIVLSNMVKNFLNGVGEYASVQDNSQLHIEVSGLLGIEESIEGLVFDFNSATSSNRRVIVDFAKATIPNVALNDTTLAIMSCTEQVVIKNANIKATQQENQTLYILHGGNHDNNKIYVIGSNGTLYGAYDCEVSNSKIDIVNASGTAYGAYSCKKVLYNTINMNTGTSIRANGKQLLMGNFVNQAINVSTTVVNIGTIIM